MQAFNFWDLFVQIALYAGITAVVLAYFLYRRWTVDVHTMVRVHFQGGTEKRFRCAEVERSLSFKQDGIERDVAIAAGDTPDRTTLRGIPYHVYDVEDGQDITIIPPWRQPKPEVLVVADEPEAKDRLDRYFDDKEKTQRERYRRRVRVLQSFREFAKGLGRINRWQAAALIFLGFFAGLYLAPIIAGALAG